MNQIICTNCFREKPEHCHVCPHCGYDPAVDAGKYPLALKPESILNGRYILGRTLGQGGFGITYLAREVDTRQKVAIKEFFPETMVTRTGSHQVTAYTGQRQENFSYGLECFLSEARTMAEFIGIETIVQVYSYFEENGTAYFVMEYVEGTSLQDHLKSRGGKLSWKETAEILLPVMDALTAVHEKGIIHRDIAPDNIYITSQGRIKLLDFGSARYSLGDKSRSLDVILKHGYAPTEQYTRRGKQGPFTDVYALAATFYHCLTGHVPQEAVERMDEDLLVLPSVRGADLPEEAENALEKALSIRSSDRFQSMAQFREALQVALVQDAEPGEEPEPVQVPEPVQEPKLPPVPPRQRSAVRKLLIPGAAGLALAVAGAAVLLPKASAPEQPQSQAAVSYIQETTTLLETIAATEPSAPWPEGKLLAFDGKTFVEVLADGTVALHGEAIPNGEAVSQWRDIATVDIGQCYAGNSWENAFYPQVIGLRKDGTVVSTGEESEDWNQSQWKNIRAIAANSASVAGLQADGTVVLAGSPREQISINNWADIVDIAVSDWALVGLKKDGTVKSVYAIVSDWTDIQAIATARTHVVGLREDGTVLTSVEMDVSGWRDITAIAAGEGFTLGLRADGTVLSAGVLPKGGTDPASWTDIVAIIAREETAIALKADGTLETCGKPLGVEVSLSGWKARHIPGWTPEAEEKTGLSTGTVKQGPLNIREEPSVNAAVVGSYEEGDQVTIYEQTENGWGRTDQGWIVTSYVILISN